MDAYAFVAGSYPFLTAGALWAQKRAMAADDASKNTHNHVTNIEMICRYLVCFIPFLNMAVIACYVEHLIPKEHGFVQWLTRKRKDNK